MKIHTEQFRTHQVENLKTLGFTVKLARIQKPMINAFFTRDVVAGTTTANGTQKCQSIFRLYVLPIVFLGAPFLLVIWLDTIFR